MLSRVLLVLLVMLLLDADCPSARSLSNRRSKYKHIWCKHIINVTIISINIKLMLCPPRSLSLPRSASSTHILRIIIALFLLQVFLLPLLLLLFLPPHLLLDIYACKCWHLSKKCANCQEQTGEGKNEKKAKVKEH